MDDKQTDAFWAFTGEAGCSATIDSFSFGVNGADIDRIESLSGAVGASELAKNCSKLPSETALCVWITWLDCAERGYKRLYGAPVRIPYASMTARTAKPGLPTTIGDEGLSASSAATNAAPLPPPFRSMRLPLDLQWKAKTPIFPLPVEYSQADAPPAYPCARPASALALSTTPPRFEPASPDVFYFNNGGCLLVHPDDLHPHSMELCRQAERTWSSAHRTNPEGASESSPPTASTDSEPGSKTNPAESLMKTVPGQQSSGKCKCFSACEDNGSSPTSSIHAPGDCHGNANKQGTAACSENQVGTGTGVAPAHTPGGKRPPKQTLEEELLNERQRRRCLGISRYVWSKEGKKILLSNSSGLWIYDHCSAIESLLDNEPPRRLPVPSSSISPLGAGTTPSAASETGHRKGEESGAASSCDVTFFATNPLTPFSYMVPNANDSVSRSISGQSPLKTENASVEATSGEMNGRVEDEAETTSALDEHFATLKPPTFATNNQSSMDPASRPRVSIHPSGRSHAFGSPRLVVPRRKEGRSILDFSFSPDASRVAFVHDSDIHVAAIATSEKQRLLERHALHSDLLSDEDSEAKENRAQALNGGLCMLTTSGKSGKIVNGLAEYVAQEEMYRSRGYWWSPCGNFIAFCQFTEDHIKPLCLQRVRLPQYQASDASEGGAAGAGADSKKQPTEAAASEPNEKKALPSESGQNASGGKQAPQWAPGPGDGVIAEDGEEENRREEREEEWSEDEHAGSACVEGGAREESSGDSRLGEKKGKTQELSRDAEQRHSEEAEELLVQEEHHFPFAGMDNVRIRVGILQVPSAAELQRVASSFSLSVSSRETQTSNGDAPLPSVFSISSTALPGYSLETPLEACARCSVSCICGSVEGNAEFPELCSSRPPADSSTRVPSTQVAEQVSGRSRQKHANSSSAPNASSRSSGPRWGARERFIELPVADWREDFYVARAQWISLEEWSDLVVLKLLSTEEVKTMQNGIRRRALEREGASSASGEDGRRSGGCCAEVERSLEDPVSPPPLLLLQLQDRLQQELRICAALPWLPSDFSEMPNENSRQDEKLRCVVCFTERSSFWINLHDDLHQLGRSLWYLWTAERKTMNELYLQNLALPGLSFRVCACAPEVRLISVLAPPTSPIFSSSGHRYVLFSANRQSGASPASAFVCLTRLPKDSELKALQRSCLLSVHESEEKGRPEDTERVGWLRGKFWGQRGKWKIEIRDLRQPWALVTNPAVEGTHSFIVSEKLPLVVHQHHARLSPRQIWIRYIPDWDEALLHEHVSPISPSPLHYSLASAVQRGRVVFHRQLRLSDETEKSVNRTPPGQASTETEKKTKDMPVDEKAQSCKQQNVSQDVDLQLLHGCEQLTYAYGDTAAFGKVLHEFQQVQRVYLRIVRSLVPPVPFELENEGEKLFGCYYRPNVALHGSGPYRAVVSLYGGPTLQFVPDAFDLLLDMRAQALAKLGLIVVKVDNRGSFGRSIAFEKAAIHRRLGAAELRDQRAAVMHLHRLGLVALHAEEAARVSPVSPSLGLCSGPSGPATEPGEAQKTRAHALGQKRERDTGTPRGMAAAGKRVEAEEKGASQALEIDSGNVARQGRKRAKTEGGSHDLDRNAERTTVAAGSREAQETGREDEQEERQVTEKTREILGSETKHTTDLGAVGGDSLISYGVGIYGISYGGYLAAMAHFTHPDFFTCCWSAAPVTAWELYSTHYTERYLSLPCLNSEGYKQSSVLTHVKFLEPQTNRLKLLHGYLDENVHMQHSLILLDKMIRHQLPADFLCLPQSRHGPSIATERRFFVQTLHLFFSEHLLPAHLRPKWPRQQRRSGSCAPMHAPALHVVSGSDSENAQKSVPEKTGEQKGEEKGQAQISTCSEGGIAQQA
ncbi:dipeptidyl peptidase iv (dpp iv) n-terminal region domain-containing protein [Toxoplasma gondii ME49]|uniref:Dipeptidyl peptidase iv (Dpp iv) n-terminal region domain-containing protein n=1 Tax=Toxoplasma gondii (strain ATCC 50611 / Me49) TaxID=508771 RepID=S8G961_TOXGM|nr:dipeptidyl peptidase iv (dpp iv) n-terminal region domain-containing protein [Toxoplasma gondii ME49]EPT24794.1 dipeptidyl peptidase iv (dpp iv) n-terminal region domain-containing protein [Toxoplasma gondii ME49]|eukprot:XP_018634885.1 dipeptidyl peptidase iv (dpp iv) n-terminal region domain-containing protein [Toxoplasma gondii ME49]